MSYQFDSHMITSLLHPRPSIRQAEWRRVDGLPRRLVPTFTLKDSLAIDNRARNMLYYLWSRRPLESQSTRTLLNLVAMPLQASGTLTFW